jgi:hypothetical protein
MCAASRSASTGVYAGRSRVARKHRDRREKPKAMVGTVFEIVFDMFIFAQVDYMDTEAVCVGL